jgi:hypothetical protein
MVEYHHYEIVQGSKDQVVEKVNKLLQAGYVPIGGICVVPPTPQLEQKDYYIQAMAMRSVLSRRER